MWEVHPLVEDLPTQPAVVAEVLLELVSFLAGVLSFRHFP